LQVQLGVTGARIEPAAQGAILILNRCGRKIAYTRLRATDATGRELPARLEVVADGARPSRRFASPTTPDAPISNATQDATPNRPESRPPMLASSDPSETRE